MTVKYVLTPNITPTCKSKCRTIFRHIVLRPSIRHLRLTFALTTPMHQPLAHYFTTTVGSAALFENISSE